MTQTVSDTPTPAQAACSRIAVLNETGSGGTMFHNGYCWCWRSYSDRLLFLIYLCGTPQSLVLLILLAPQTQVWSQSSGLKSNNSNETSQTWQQISVKFQSELTALRRDLQAALSDAQQSKTYLQKLTGLYENSLTRITNLETFNEQIGQRMQESDEWNAELQCDNVKLEAKVKMAKAHTLRSILIAGIVGIVLGILVPFILKMLRTFKVISI
jgi:hypothetical protein